MPVIRPQLGPQTKFLSSPADIAIYGGGAGGGKTWALLLEPLRHIANPDFSAVIFRREGVQITNPGGLWDEARGLYSQIPGAKSIGNPLQWSFPSGAKIRFSHINLLADVFGWQGSQLPLLCFDELTHFAESQFFYMLSRNRSLCGVRPYVRATCNPDADSWVARFISWWIDQQTGLPIPERAGVIRYFVRAGDVIMWGDSPADLPVQQTPDGIIIPPKSVTFIPAKVTDNAALMAGDPAYYGNLMALPTVERERLLDGNWKIRPAGGLYFRREWAAMLDAEPGGLEWVRYWDLAATEKTETNDPDWTVGVKLGRDKNGFFYIGHVERLRGSPGAVQDAILATARQDGPACRIGIPQDPGQAGKAHSQYLVRQLAGYNVTSNRETGSKIVRFGPVSAQARARNLHVVRGTWNEDFFTSLEGFPDAPHDDDADALAGAFAMLGLDDPLIVPENFEW